MIATTDQVLFFIEAKFLSGNKTHPSEKTDRDKLRNKYTTGADNWFDQVFDADFDELVWHEHLYELTRFWLLGSWMADQMGKRFSLNFS